ncbi:2-polyprenyl-3-methyl-6-methoxy-1,4-benzoquinone monooxygenase [Sulfuriferula sp.]|uniref:2-polyprenyl-3-methyl-6-methoxy-1,4-benzoquinone monooxygenase n=1 Tax=Sulfuriferula sp. TaxID=2025307 RepID=UPI002730186A|nr:2-polyprenyl-3-methyl-6-methoxy-1,4-benzoquinone monooxygenase [Sulfuriferula sp.]MDP2025209.1 2-polyprenyl-3-methyl-6-methoxy-1,4-benzoquinone monooxygenase [Sulfuriferula sp.]
MTLDKLIIEFDKGLRTLLAPAQSARPLPGRNLPEAALSDADKQHAAALMRVNHVGEVCAQALYQGQALTARNPDTKAALDEAAREETEHLAWCEARITALGGRKSLLNPLWYSGALAMGMTAGALGDKWNLGFLAETERQVEAHLHGHLDSLPAADAKSRAVVEQMKQDEARHADTAVAHGGRALPKVVAGLMRAASKVMTATAYRV